MPQTGQTTSFATGDDGDVQAGVEWPNPRFTANVDMDNDGDCTDAGETCDGTVTDNLTGLIWLKNANCFGSLSWAGALTAANTLNSGECGLTDGSIEGDWYLPNRNQLTSLLDLGKVSLALPTGHPFINFESSNYWSSTTSAGNSGFAWGVFFIDGSVNGALKGSGFFVTAVRGGS